MFRLRMIAIAAAAVLGGALTSGCAGVVLNDPGLAKQVDDVDKNVQAGLSLSAYDDRIARLKAFAADEDKADAELGVAQRNLAVAEILARDISVKPPPSARHAKSAMPPPSPRADALRDAAEARLKALAGSGGSALQGSAFATLADDNDKVALLGALVDSDRFAYEQAVTAGDRANAYDCKALAGATLGDKDPKTLKDLKADCAMLDGKIASRKKDLESIVGTDHSGLMWGALAASQPAQTEPSKATEADAKLAKAIADAKAAAKNSDVAALAAFADQVTDALKDLSAAAKVAKWQQAEAELDAGAKALACKGPNPSADLACSSVKVTSPEGRAMALWALAQALAEASDADKPALQSARWLAAASAIASAHEQDEKLQATAEKAAAQAAGQQLNTMLAEAELLVRARDSAQGASDCGRSAWACAMPAYVASWNVGRIPEGVLANRAPQASRLSLVQRQRAAAAAQQTLIQSADGTLKAYGEGGVQPNLVAQLLVSLGLISVAAAK